MALSRSDKETIQEMIKSTTTPAAPVKEHKCQSKPGMTKAEVGKVVDEKNKAKFKEIDDKLNMLYTELQALKTKLGE